MIDFKCSQWIGDPKMQQFLQPDTLFAPSHFEGYLQAAKAWRSGVAENHDDKGSRGTSEYLKLLNGEKPA